MASQRIGWAGQGQDFNLTHWVDYTASGIPTAT